MDETQTIRGSKQGEAEGFRVLVERYERVLFGTAFLMTRDRTLAEDMVQVTFLLAWRSIRSFREGTSFKAWLIRIMVNRIMAERRKKRFSEAQLLEVMAAPASAGNAESEAITQDEQRRVRQALDGLGRESREAILLRYYSDLTVPEIATALGWREGTVKSRIHRALSQLEKLINDEHAQGSTERRLATNED